MNISSLDLVAIEKVASVDYLEQVFACYRSGRIAVPVDREGSPPPGHGFAERIVPQAGGGWFTLEQAPIADDRPAQVSFSSGTTGLAKAVLLSHRALADATERLIDVMEIEPDIAEYLGVPPTYSFGLARARVTAAVGGRLFVPDHGFDPAEFARMLAADEVNALSAVPTLLRLLIANPELVGDAADKLRWLEIGSQPMSADEKRALRRLFPEARIVQHYGLTEASRTTFLDVSDAGDKALGSVGRPIGKTEVRIDDEGRICIRGPHVADGLLTEEGLVPIVDAEGWLVTNDAGRMDGKLLFFEGRTDDLINVAGVKVPAEAFEQAVRATLPAGVRLAAGPAPDAQRGQRIALAHENGDEAAVRAAVEGAAPQFGIPVNAVSIFRLDTLPVTETGKVQRRKLGDLMPAEAARPAATAAPSAAAVAPAVADDRLPRNEEERKLAAVWEQALGISPIYRDESFFSMGGDSLAAINVLLAMERAGIPGETSRRIFEGRTIAEISREIGGDTGDGDEFAAEMAIPTREARANEGINITRGLLVLVVLAGHWGPFFLSRMGQAGRLLGEVLYPVFRMGTPGFAIVFGMGMGYFQYHGFKRNAESTARRLRTSMMIVGTGVIALAAANALDIVANEGGLGPQWAASTLYSVLLFYTVATVLTVPLLRLLDRWPHVPLNALIGSGLCLTVYMAAALLLPVQQEGLTELGRLMVMAKYGLPSMFGTALIGVAIGVWVRLDIDRTDLSPVLAKAGIAALLGGIALSVQDDPGQWFNRPVVSIAVEIAYAGVIMLLLAGAIWRLGKPHRAGPLAMAERLVGLLGILAFPIYIGHMVLMRVHGALETRIPASASIAITMIPFFLVIAFALVRVNRVVHAGTWPWRRR